MLDGHPPSPPIMRHFKLPKTVVLPLGITVVVRYATEDDAVPPNNSVYFRPVQGATPVDGELLVRPDLDYLSQLVGVLYCITGTVAGALAHERMTAEERHIMTVSIGACLLAHLGAFSTVRPVDFEAWRAAQAEKSRALEAAAKPPAPTETT